MTHKKVFGQNPRVGCGKKLKVSLLLLLTLLITVGTYVVAPGFARSLVGHSLLAYVYPIPDEPSDTPAACRKSILGSHYFGDFQSEFCRLRFNRAYGDRSMKAVKSLLVPNSAVDNEYEFAENIRITPSLLPKVQWTTVGNPYTEWVVRSHRVNLTSRTQSPIGLISTPIRVRLQDPVMVRVFISPKSVSDKTDENVRLTIEWLNAQREMISSSNREWDLDGHSTRIELQVVDAPPRDSSFMRMRVDVANSLGTRYEFHLPMTIYRLNSFSFESIHEAFDVAAKVRIDLRSDPYLVTDDQSDVHLLVDGLLRGLIEPGPAHSALAQAEVVPGTRQFPAFFVYMLPLLLLDDLRVVLATVFVLVLLVLYWVLRKVAAKRVDVLLLVPSVGYAAWRGNFAWIVATALLLSWLAKFAKEEKKSLLLICAAALKPNLLLFATLYLSRRNFKQFMTVVLGFIVVQIASGLLFMENSSDVRRLVKVSISSSNLFGADDQRLGMRSDLYSLITAVGRYIFSTDNFWIPSVAGTKLISLIGIFVVTFICLLSMILGQRIDESQKCYGALTLIIAAGTLLVSPPTFIYSLMLVGVVPIVFDFGRSIRVLIAAVLLPVLVPLPVVIALPPSFVSDSLVRWPDQPGAWTHWSIAGVVSSCVLVFLLIDRSVFLLRSVASSRESSELSSMETR